MLVVVVLVVVLVVVVVGWAGLLLSFSEMRSAAAVGIEIVAVVLSTVLLLV